MNIRIFDVAHGFCAYVVTDTRNVILFDCGHDINRDFAPSKYLYGETACTGIELFVVCNYDEDHIADLPNLREHPITSLQRNKSIDSNQLRALKEKQAPCSDAMEALLEMMDSYTSPVAPPIDYGGAERVVFCNKYPDFKDTNNLSVVTFLHYRDIHIVFTGDLETAGWQALLKDSAFRDQLGQVNIFVASHHGRASGYCREVFDYCKPQVIIISDAEHEDTSQVEIYEKHAGTGIAWKGKTKKVLNTWDCGHIKIEQKKDGAASLGPA